MTGKFCSERVAFYKLFKFNLSYWRKPPVRKIVPGTYEPSCNRLNCGFSAYIAENHWEASSGGCRLQIRTDTAGYDTKKGRRETRQP